MKDLDANGALLAILRVQLRLSDAAATHTLEGLLRKVLDEAEALTGSCIGFFHFLEKDQQTLSLQAWSSNTLQSFCTAEAKGLHYNVDTAGVWVDCIRQRRPVIHNDYAELPHRKGVPEGHPSVIREIFNSTSEAIIIHDAGTGKIIDVNETTLRSGLKNASRKVLRSLIGFQKRKLEKCSGLKSL